MQIYEAILGDKDTRVTPGLLFATQYLKDNRLLPHGFDKVTAAPEISVFGSARNDPGFTDRGHEIRYSIDAGNAPGPFEVNVELWYQPIGYRWAKNLQGYAADEPRRFNAYYDSMGSGSAVLLLRKSTSTP